MTHRQDMGCVYEERTAAPRTSFVLRRSGMPMLDWSPSVCPLYLGRLAERSDAMAALPAYRKGTLMQWLDGSASSRPLIDVLSAVDLAFEAYAHDDGRPPRKKGPVS